MLSDEQGMQAIIELQEMGGVVETKEKATEGWAKMSNSAKEQTEASHLMFCGGFNKQN